MLFVEICVSNSFIFSVSALTIFQPWFLSYGNLVFFSDIILFKISIFIFASCVSLCSVWFGCVVLRLLLLYRSFRLECSCFSVFNVSIIVLESCCLDYLLLYLLYFKVRKSTFLCYRPNLVSESLDCCLKSCVFFPDFYPPFSIPTLCRVAPKLQ